MNIPKLALRNLQRNRRRSATTLLAVVIGVASILLFGGYIRNIVYGLQTGFVQSGGHLQIQHRDYFLFGTGNPAMYGIDGYEPIIEAIRRDPKIAPMLRVATPSLQITGLAGNFSIGVSRTVMGMGVVVDEQNKLRTWNDYHFSMTPRPLALTRSADNAAVIGVGLARTLQLCVALHVTDCPQPASIERPAAEAAPDLPQDIADLSAVEKAASPPASARPGAQIDLLAANSGGAPNVVTLEVVKAESKGFKELDDMYVGLHLAQAQKLVYGGAKRRVTAIALQLEHTNQMPQARREVERVLATHFADKRLKVHEFYELFPFYDQSIAMFRAIFGFIALLVGAIVLFTVGNTMNMAVVERTVEIGTLRAMGLRRRAIRSLFVWEGFLVGLLGAAVGVSFALAVSWTVERLALTWTPPGWTIPVPLTVNIWGETSLIAGGAAGMVLVAVISAFMPAARASRMKIVDALRHV